MNRHLQGADFAARKYSGQRRKNADGSPCSNHPLEVALHLPAAGPLDEEGILVAALICECSDDKSLPKLERQRLQIDNAPKKSREVKLIKIADKTCNLRSVPQDPPADWSLTRQYEHFVRAGRVAAGLPGETPALDHEVKRVLDEGLRVLKRLAEAPAVIGRPRCRGRRRDRAKR